uniref:RanBD1 domain-containing protein n=1 Tax=Branchiostoma floridae TaxID=7739 RepID=C3ZK41_BRAFL|eukprot:XP_002590929.1 hypothetical protein BRAFLDRAFT_129561 [Branchiostoma floridae]
MAAKRTATSELTDRNWDQEEEPEEAGTWNPASREEMSKRRVKKAMRRGAAGSEGGSGAFAKFSGFSSKPSSAVFSLNSNAKPLAVSNGNKPSVPFSGFGTGSSTPSPVVSERSPAGGHPSPRYSPQYCAQLQGLNRSLLQWLQKHVDNNPICDLTPSFRDYEKHLRDIEASTSGGAGTFGGAAGKPALDSGFKFGTTSSSSSASSGFKFSFASKPSAPTTASSETKEDEDYEPPKPEVKEVKEEGAFYTTRCKLFYQKDGTYKDKGVGNLHLKKTGDSKTQLVVRADTSLGNILLNILLFPSMPVSRQGKNNVALVCVPNPPLGDKTDPAPTPMLIRVKTGEAADELCKQLCDNKGSS